MEPQQHDWASTGGENMHVTLGVLERLYAETLDCSVEDIHQELSFVALGGTIA